MNPFDTAHDPQVGVAEVLAEDIRVVTAGNAAPMTFTGTRTYLVGRHDLAVIDPGPKDETHFKAVLQAIGGARVSAVVVTHAHLDHSPLAGQLAEAVGAPVYGFGAWQAAELPDGLENLGGGEGIDRGFAPDVVVADGEVISGAGWALEAVHTPGHLGDHIALAHGDALFSGDHVMGWATTMISPPDGDLNAFMGSLDRLMGRSEAVYYPGHGAPVRDPHRLMAHIKAHRLGREAQILEALNVQGGTVAGLTGQIYAEVPKALHGAASRNVLAHLLALVERGEVGFEQGDAGPVFGRV